MKYLSNIIIFFSAFFLFWGCNKNDNPANSTNELGLGNLGGKIGNVTVQVQLVQDNQQQCYFEFTHSTIVYMIKFLVAAQKQELIMNRLMLI